MATSYKKMDTTDPIPEDVKDEDKWKYQNVEKSVTQSPMKSRVSYEQCKSQLDSAKARVAELEADLAEIEAKAKS
jgi:archaellum component FlaC